MVDENGNPIVQPSNVDYAIDTAAMGGGSGGSIWDDATNLVTKAMPLVARSAFLSFKNMPADIGNWFGGDNHLETMQELLGEGEENADAKAYYEQHQQGIDAVGLIAGSFAPGLGASKLFAASKLVTAIKAGQVTEEVSRATGLLPAVQNAKVLAAAKKAITDNASAYHALTADTIKASMLGVADMALQSAAWETATIATMHSNPVLNSDGLGDSIDHIFWGGVTGGLFAAPFSILGSRMTLKTVMAQQELLEKGQEILTKQGAAALVVGDPIAQTLASVWEHEFMNPAKSASEIAKSETRAAAIKLDAAQKLNFFTDDPAVSNGILEMMYKLKQDGVPLVGRGDELGVLDHMMQLKSAHRINNPKFLTEDSEAFYLNIHNKDTAGDFLSGSWMSLDRDSSAVHSRRFKFSPDFQGNTLRFAVEGDPMAPQVTAAQDFLALTAADAWKADMHLWLDRNNRLHINEAKIGKDLIELPKDLQLTPEQRLTLARGSIPGELTNAKGELISNSANIVLDLRTGAVTKSAEATVGDLSHEVKLVNSKDGLSVGSTVFEYGLAKQYAPATLSATEANGRFTWAHMRGLQRNDVIGADDLPMLEAAVYHLGDKTPADIMALKLKLKDAQGVYDFPVNVSKLQDMVLDLKKSTLQSLQSAPGVTAEQMAMKINAPLDALKDLSKLEDFTTSSVNPTEHLKLSHVRMNYAINPMVFDATGNTVRGQQAMQYRIDAAKELAMNAGAAFFGRALEQIAVKGTSAEATMQKTAAGMLARADADYSTLANAMQAAGQALVTKINNAKDQFTKRIAPHVNALLADSTLATELAIFRNTHLRMSEKFTFLDTDNPMLKQQAERMLGRSLKKGEGIVVPRAAIGIDEAGNPFWKTDYKPKMADNPKDAANWMTADEISKMRGGVAEIGGGAKALGMYNVSPEVSRFLRAQMELNDERLVHQNNLFSATGNPRRLETGNIYVPPMNTRNYPFVAFVRQREGLGGGTSSTAAVLGQSSEELQTKIAQIKANHPELEVFTKGQQKEYFKARGDYDYNLNLIDNDVNSMLKKEGILVDYVPNANGKTALTDYAEWNANQITRLHRNYAELVNGQLYAELEMMGKQYEWMANSKIGKVNQISSSLSADNPYQSLRYQGLGISSRADYTLWNDAQDKAEALFTTAFNKAREAFGKAASGLIPFEEANKICRQYGLGDAYGTTLDAMRNYQVAGAPVQTPMLEKFVRTANSIQTALAIRLDAMQGLINLISTPILMWPEALDAARKVGVSELPGAVGTQGQPINVLTLTKLMGNSIQKWHSDKPADKLFKQELFERGLLNVKPTAYYDLLNDLTMTGSETASKYAQMMSSAVDKTADLIKTNFSEQFGRFMAADVARQIFSAAGHTDQELWANINTFINRVHGASIAAQRPVAFQGPIGAAIGLFQTYQFNFMQNVFRYVGEGNYKALSLLAGLQTTLYGMQGLPGFNLINQSIIGNAVNNPAHSDIYSGTKSLLGEHMANWVLYGSASNVLNAGIYTRGDVNPRQLTILPINPADIPTVSTGIRALQNLYQATEKMQGGDNFWNVFTQALEHNGASRPLAGLGQLLQGYTTTSKGSLISAIPQPADLSGALDFLSIANAMRLVGARPLDEAVIMDAMYRRTAYQAADTARMETLGLSVKDALRKNQVPTDEQLQTFVQKYAAAGGAPQNFGKSMLNWAEGANTSVANAVYSKLKTPAIQNQQLIMGGKKLPDYSMAPIQGISPSTAAASTDAAPTF